MAQKGKRKMAPETKKVGEEEKRPLVCFQMQACVGFFRNGILARGDFSIECIHKPPVSN